MPENRPNSKTSAWLWLLLALVMATRLFSAWDAYRTDPDLVRFPDTGSYVSPAYTIMELGRFSVDLKHPDWPAVDIPPGYPLFIAGVYTIFGKDSFALLAIQILISVLTIFTVYASARSLWGQRSGLWAALLMSLGLGGFNYSQLILSDTLLTFMLTLAMACGIRLYRGVRRPMAWALLLGFLISAAAMVRPIAYFLIFPVAGLTALAWGRYSLGWRKSLVLGLAVLIPWLVIVGGWKVRNYSYNGSWEFAHIKNLNFMWWRTAQLVADRDGISIDQAREILRQKMPHKDLIAKNGYIAAFHPELSLEENARLKEYYGREAVKMIWDDIWVYLKGQTARGFVQLTLVPGVAMTRGMFERSGPLGDLGRLSLSVYLDKWLLNKTGFFLLFLFALAHLLLVYFSGAVGLAQSLGQSDIPWKVHALVWGVTAYLVLASSGYGAGVRFRLPMMPFLCLYAGHGLARLTGGSRQRHSRRLTL